MNVLPMRTRSKLSIPSVFNGSGPKIPSNTMEPCDRGGPCILQPATSLPAECGESDLPHAHSTDKLIASAKNLKELCTKESLPSATNIKEPIHFEVQISAPIPITLPTRSKKLSIPSVFAGNSIQSSAVERGFKGNLKKEVVEQPTPIAAAVGSAPTNSHSEKPEILLMPQENLNSALSVGNLCNRKRKKLKFRHYLVQTS